MELKGSKLFITLYLLSTFAKSFFDKYWELEGQIFLSEWDKIKFSSTHNRKKNIFLWGHFWSDFVTFLQQDVGNLIGFLGTIAVSEEEANNCFEKPWLLSFVITFHFGPFDQFTTNILTFAYVHAFQTEINGAKRRRKTELWKTSASIDQTTRKLFRLKDILLHK